MSTMTRILISLSMLALSQACLHAERDLLDGTEPAGAALAALVGDTSSGTPSGSSALMIFVSNSTMNGGFGGTASADSVCNSDVNRPNSGTFQAMLVQAAVRVGCVTANCSGGVSENTNWPLRPNTSYIRTDGVTTILTTNASGIHDFSIAPNLPAAFTTSVLGIWTGINSDWTTASNDCATWADGSGGSSGARGVASFTNSGSISGATAGCSSIQSLLCVQQP